jgi:mannitol-1-/sugar-/sorbitol-6-/2-deoxyglucose-6-phosphatase
VQHSNKPSNTRAKAIIFDMDGLLVDSESVWFVAEEALIAQRGFNYTAEAREQIVGLRMDEFMVKLRDIYELQEPVDALCDELVDRLMAVIDTEIKPQPGAHELVDYVVRQNIPRAIASSSPIEVIDATLATQGWQDAFTILCTADDEEYGKPAPDVYLTAARQLGIDPVHCLALEDSPNGARAAIAAGMTCYAVPDRSHTKGVAFNGITPYVFDSLHEVLEAIKT